MAHHTIDLGELDLNKFQGLGRILHQAFDPDGGGGLICDLKVYGSEGSTSFLRWDYSEDKLFIQRTTEDTAPGRLVYIQHLGSAMAVNETIQGLQLRSRATGTGTIAGGTDGMEVKCGLNSDDDTGTLALARAVIANVDAKKGTITLARMFECTADIKAGGEITVLMGYRASLNNSGTVGTSYAFKVDQGSIWDYGLFLYPSMTVTGIYIGTCITGIEIAGTQTNGITIADAVTGITISDGTTGIYVTADTAGEFHSSLATDSDIGAYAHAFQTEITFGGDIAAGKRCSCAIISLKGTPIVDGEIYGLWINWAFSGAFDASGADVATLLYLINNSGLGPAEGPISFIHMRGPTQFVFEVHNAGDAAGAVGAGPGTQDGHLVINVNGSTRYINLYR